MKLEAELRKPGAIPTEVARMEFVIKPSSLGLILVARRASSGCGLCAVFLDEDQDALRHHLQDSFPGVSLIDGDAELDALATRVVELVESPARDVDVPLDMRGTEFQKTVWQALREIPAGSTASYTDIARRIGRPTAIRAVGHACATNALAVIIPCHRAVRSDGSLAGYRWGIERKRILLEREAASRAHPSFHGNHNQEQS
ncbi:MAG TPA: methylated-DNA--[protein]-cysteine S-methyltransferase [Gemmatimonadaceae bacterium]